jgi:hypothetical protein
MTEDPEFKGVVSDIGGPTANMYEMKCTRPEVEAVCRRQSCVHPTICKLLGTDHGPLVQLMRKARETPGIKKVLVASGIRMDLARRSPEYMQELVRITWAGTEGRSRAHTDPRRADKMRKPSIDDFEAVRRGVRERVAEGRQEAVPGALLHRQPSGQRSERDDRSGRVPQTQRLPAGPGPGLHPRAVRRGDGHVLHGLDPFTKQPVYIAKHLRIANCSGR